MNPLFTHLKLGLALSTTTLAFLALFPHNVKIYATVAVGMITVDTITGVWAAAACHNLRSSTMRERLSLKLNQYLIYVIFGASISAMTESWWFLQMSFWAIIATESFSLIESLIKIEKAGGSNLRTVSNFLNMASIYFDGQSIEQLRSGVSDPSDVVSKVTVSTEGSPTRAATSTTATISIPTNQHAPTHLPDTPAIVAKKSDIPFPPSAE